MPAERPPAVTGIAARANNFDALRLFAALAVIFSHAFLIAEGSEASEPFVWLTGNQTILGLLGVFVFFTISGYLVTESWCREPVVWRFAAKRAARIYPGLLVNMLVCALVLGAVVSSLPVADYLRSSGVTAFAGKVISLNPGPLHLPEVAFSGTSVQRLVNGSLWTLRYEAMMYGMVLLLGLTRLLRLSTSLILVVAGVIAVYFETLLTPFGDIGEWAWLVGFFATGMVLYFLRDVPGVFDKRLATLAAAALVATTWAGGLIMLFPLTGSYLAIWFARRHDHWLDFGRHAGDLSYGLYIYGWPAAQLVMWLSGGQAPWYAIFFGSLALAGPAAWLSWHLVEKPALQLVRRRAGAVRGSERLAVGPVAP